MSTRDIIEAAKAVPGGWFSWGRWAATDTCDISGMPQADRDYLRLVCDPAHIALMEAVCEAVCRWRHANEIGLGVRGASEALIAADTALAAYRNGEAS